MLSVILVLAAIQHFVSILICLLLRALVQSDRPKSEIVVQVDPAPDRIPLDKVSDRMSLEQVRAEIMRCLNLSRSKWSSLVC